jgi:hypothetical protein
MIDCSTEMTEYYDDEVALPSTARTQMRDHRDANRKRLRNGLTKAEKPLPKNFHSQGSYAMKTMVQHDDNKYDIDDGVYFDKDQLVGDRGGEMTALAVRQMVRDAVDDGSFARAPEVRKHCVRVYYQAGYHVDLPIYRKVEEKNWSGDVTSHYELASSDETILQTMKAIRDRLKWDLEVAHPVTPNDKLSKGTDDPKIAFFRDKLSDAIEWLKPLESSDCTKADALGAWDKVFNTNYFSDRDVSEEAAPTTKSASWIGPVVASAAILGTISAEAAKSRPVNKSGSNRYA